MSKSIHIEPVTRIEGHMKVETEVSGGVVTEAKISGQMYRGFEKFLEGRHPVDAARIAQRVCGVCHEVHGIASILALEELYGVQSPKNGAIVRDLILGMHLVTDHLLHFYTLSIPDYADFTKILEYNGKDATVNNLKEWVIKTKPKFVLDRNKGNYISDVNTNLNYIINYFTALQLRSKCASGLAILGAKVPFTHALLPGGVTTDIDSDKLMQYYNNLTELEAFVNNKYIPDVIELSKRYPEYFNIGVSHNNFFANNTFKTLDSGLFKGGVAVNGQYKDFDFAAVKESLDNSYYNNDGDPNPEKAGAYSWIKSPTYDGQPLEVGPLARMVINKDKGFAKTMANLGQKTIKSSTMARHLSRAYESKQLLKHMHDLLNAYKLGEPTINKIDMSKPVNGSGLGLSIAARGGLIHNIHASNGKITKYNMIVPSTWNFGPAVGDKLGVAEQSLIGTPVAFDKHNSIEAGRIIRSYDPCTACSVH